MPARLLIIASEETVNRIARIVPSERWTVHGAELGAHSLKAVLRLKPDGIILDARDEGQSFPEFCRTLRSIEEVAHAPFVALIEPRECETLDLLEAGVDDCWSEAIETREFEIRLTGIHRRLRGAGNRRVVRRGAIELDLDRYSVRSRGLPVHLTAKQLTVLQFLMEHSGIAVSNRDLLERAWRNAELDEGAVRTCIRRLRQALSATGATNVIRNVSGGYVFDTETQPLKLPWP